MAIFAVGMVLLVSATSGVAIDGTRAFLLRRSLQNAADSAARAGAGRIDRSLYRSTGGSQVTVDAGRARNAIERILVSRKLEADAEIAITGEGVEVTLRSSVPASFLRLMGVTRLDAAARAWAEPIPGMP